MAVDAEQIRQSSFAARKAPGLPKLKDIAKRPHQDSFSDSSVQPDIAFVYADADSFASELAELYCYSETEDFLENYRSFLAVTRRHQLRSEWLVMDAAERQSVVLSLLDDIEVVDHSIRRHSVRAMLYLLQGCFMEFTSSARSVALDQTNNNVSLHENGAPIVNGSDGAASVLLRNVVINAYLLFEHGALLALCTELSFYVEDSHSQQPAAARRPSNAVSLSDSSYLRAVLSAIYILTECLRRDLKQQPLFANVASDKLCSLQQSFLSEIGVPSCGNQPLVLVLFNMITKFCAGSAAHFPMRKVLLLLWKSILAWLGGWEQIKIAKNQARLSLGLPACCEDTLDVTRCMRSAQPPAIPVYGDLTGDPGSDGACAPRRAPPPLAKRQFACSPEDGSDDDDMSKDSSDGMDMDAIDEKAQQDDDNPLTDDVVATRTIPVRARLRAGAISEDEDNNLPPELPVANKIGSRRPDSPPPSEENSRKRPLSPGTTQNSAPIIMLRNLPWSPKIREKDIENFLEHERAKFFGFCIPDDRTTMAGLPRPIHESIEAMRKHVYRSAGDLQIQREAQLQKYFFSQTEGEVADTPSEQLYRLLLPQLPHYLIALLKILLAAAPHSKAKTDAINILADVLPDALTKEAPNEFEKSCLMAIDVGRHKEVIVKAVAATLLLMLKHFKINHVYQFEYVSQHLTFANCIPLILKFFDQNIIQYVQSHNEIEQFNFPKVVLHYAETGAFPVYDPDCQGGSDSADASVRQHFAAAELSGVPDKAVLAAQDAAGSCSDGLWRNLYSAINLLRILNKLTKWKHSRTMMLVVFKSAPILKRSLRLRHILLQLYALKLLKMQAKYLGRQWRKTNMEIMSAIYSKVRHRLNDDWAYGNGMRAVNISAFLSQD